jgi:uncharacterized lipoprotein YddW (UPF0748 family)
MRSSTRRHLLILLPLLVAGFSCAHMVPGEVIRQPAVRSASAPAPSEAAPILARPAPPTGGYRQVQRVPGLPALEREFRGVWIAAVSNIDWPSRRNMTTAQQQAELVTMLDAAAGMGLNAVILHVRPAGDALYASELEPWSEYLTGEQGRAPSPYYDPLEFAITEAHRRGLELHAWFNPFRARHPSARSAPSPTHITRRRPDLVRTYGTHLWMDPSEPDVHEQALAVILDVVRRYDVDGVHIDDYFYPYQERDRNNRLIPFPDEANYDRYRRSGGTLSRDDWRRSHVDGFVRRMYAEVKATDPAVRVGISPFGIWRPGYPQGVWGLDAYRDLYADARKWLNEGWLDYMAPQLYWLIEAPQQRYTPLLAWWVGENAHGRHVWPGNHPNRVGPGEREWRPAEIVEQVRLTRAEPGATGNIHFSMNSLLRNRAGISDALRGAVYATPALPPASPWLGAAPPATPTVVVQPRAETRHTRLVLHATERPAWWLVRQRFGGDWQVRVMRATDDVLELPWPGERAPDALAVSGVSRTGVEGAPALFER